MRNAESFSKYACNSLPFADIAFLEYSCTTQKGLETRKVKYKALPCFNSERRVSLDKVIKELCW